jgi:biotin transporter BioY
MYPAGIIAGIVAGVVGAEGNSDAVAIVAGICIIGGVIAYMIGIFSIRSAMEEYYNSTENIGLSLSGVMTFFFSAVYLQYHINRIARWKKTGELK